MSEINFKKCEDENGVVCMDKVYEEFTNGALEILKRQGHSIEIEEPHNTKEAKDKLFEYLNSMVPDKKQDETTK